jgi:beta-glucanase (GH16 family)
MLKLKNILIMLFLLAITIGIANAQTLLWSDEFDGSSLDLTKWVVLDEQDWRQGREVSMFRPYNIEVSDGTLKLYNQQESTYSWSGAHIDALYHPQYKYLEARIRHSAPDTYIWATWWTVGWVNNDWQWPPEFDICEFYGQPDESPGQWYHYGSGGGDYDGSLTGMDETQWHTYGVYWSETQSPTFYVDGIITSVPGGDPTAAHMAALLKLTTSPNRDTHYNGCPLGTMEVDYVRVYDVPPDQPVTQHLALNKPADASSEENEGFSADKAVDGIDVSRWASAWSEPEWLSVDLEAAYSIDSVNIHWQYASAIEYKVQVADDPAGPWTDCVHITDNTAYDHWANLEFPAQTGRYVRVYCIQRITEWGFSIWELEVYGSATDCGDATCDPGEDQCNCPEDCGIPPSTETNCTDGDDNDCDTYTDCDDSDCDTDPACQSSYCDDGTCDPGEDQCNCPEDCGTPPATETNCTDGIDNDCGGGTDCADSDCDTDPACDCLANGEVCSDDSECCNNKCRGGKCR